MMFETNYDEILKKINCVDPIQYGKSRNFINGAVSYLSPYISRGVISTRQVFDHMIIEGYSVEKMESFVQELAWRDFWQQTWVSRGTDINGDMRNPQPRADRTGVPSAIVAGTTQISAIDKGIELLHETGYMHNHLRMYTASLACNVGRCAWSGPAKWMYYYLLDADWASNALSWQWVCGAKSNKLYFANQENINKYCNTHQTNTIVDLSYEEIEQAEIPAVLDSVEQFKLETVFPACEPLILQEGEPCFIYNFYNVDPKWRFEESGTRVLLLEPSVFREYPVSEKSINFCISLAKENIADIQIFVGEFSELQNLTQSTFYFKEHPLNKYVGVEDERDWLSGVKGEYSSFFSFWKKVRKELV